MVKTILDYLTKVEKRKRKTNSEKEYTQHLNYVKNKSYSENKTQYDNARKSMGLAPDDNLTKSKYDSMFGNEKTGDTGMYGRYQKYHQSNNNQTQATPKKSSPSFDQRIDKGISVLGKFVDSIKKTPVGKAVDKTVHSDYFKDLQGVINPLQGETFKKAMELEDKYIAAPTRNIVDSLTSKKVQIGKDISEAWKGERKVSGEELSKKTGLIDSKYGNKIAGFVAEGVLDPTNLIGAGSVGKLSKLGKVADAEKVIETVNKTGKVSKSQAKQILDSMKMSTEEPVPTKNSMEKLAEQIKQLSPKEQNLQNIKLPNGKIEVQPTVKKSMNDLLGKNKIIPEQVEPITPREAFEQQVQNSIPQAPNAPKNVVNQPISVADNFQSAIKQARETNNPQDIATIKQHTQDLIDDLDTNYKDPDVEEVKDALAKLNLQLFAGKEPAQEILAKIEGVVERAKTLKKDIKETNPQLSSEIQGMKDIGRIGTSSKNLYEVVEKLPKQHQQEILPVLDKAKKDNVNYQKMYVNDLDRNIINPKTGLGIKKGSKDSALVQDYGEKTLAKKELEKQGLTQEQINKMNPEELSKMNDNILKEKYPDKYESIKKADNFFRERYKELIDAANGTIAKIYPGQPDKLIPERADYYHHFNEMEGLEGVINQFRTPENINPDLVTISHGTQPKTKWQSFKQKRGWGEYKSDAVGGFLKYIQGVSHSTHVDPVIPAIRNVVKDLQNATSETKNLNNLIEVLNDHADDIAGKTNPYDRLIQKVGRANLRRLNAVNSRVKSNMILGNVGSTVAQVGNLPLITAKAKHHLAPGLIDTLDQFSRYATKSKKELPINKSEFLKERYIDEDFSKFDTRIIDQPKKLAVKMMTMVDKASASLAWNSFHRQGLAKKVPNPIKYADEQTRKTLAGRGIGEMGIAQKSKTAQIFMPFTYEVGHQWKVLNDIVGKKDAVGIMTFLISSYALNKVIEDVRGSGVSFDPIDALMDGYQYEEGERKDKIFAALGSLAGETVGNIPGGNLVTSAIGDKKILYTGKSLNDAFQDRNPNRFGTGLTVSKAAEDPLRFLIPPFGGNQIKKIQEGTKAIKEEGVFDKRGNLMYPIENPSIMKKLQLGTFGKYSSKEARSFFDNKRTPLSGKKTAEVMEAKDKTKAYYDALTDRYNKSIKRNKGNAVKIKELNKQLEKLKKERKENGK